MENLESLEQSLKVYIALNDKWGEGMTLDKISLIYKAEGNLPKALEYLEKSLKIAIEIGEKKGEGTILNNISQIYKDQGDLAKAFEYLQKSLAIQVAINDKWGMCATLFNIASIYLDDDNLQGATRIWLKVYHIAKEIEYIEALKALDGLIVESGFKTFEAFLKHNNLK